MKGLQMLHHVTAPVSGSASLLELLWRKKKELILKNILDDKLLDSWATDKIKSRELAKCRQTGVLSKSVIVKIVDYSNKIRPAFKTEATKRFFDTLYQRCIGGEFPSSAWEMLCLMHYIGAAIGMPPRSFPSYEDVEKIILLEENEMSLWDRMEPFIPFFKAFVSLRAADVWSLFCINFVKKCREDFSRLELESLRDVSESDKLLKKIHSVRRSFLHSMRALQKTLAAVSSNDSPVLAASLKTAGIDLAIAVQKHAKEIAEEISSMCRLIIPPEFDANVLLSILDRIIPPLTTRDRQQAEEEISNLVKGLLSPEQSPLLSLILPAIKHEREINDAIIDTEFPDLLYTHSLISNLKKKLYNLKPELTAEPELTKAPESKYEAELEPEFTKAPESEHVAELEPELTKAPESEHVAELEPELTKAPESEHVAELEPELTKAPESEHVAELEPELTKAPESEHVAELEPELTKAPESEHEAELEPELTKAPESEHVAELEPELTKAARPGNDNVSISDGMSPSKEIDSQMFAYDQKNFVPPRIICPAPDKSSAASTASEVKKTSTVSTKVKSRREILDSLDLGGGIFAETIKNRYHRVPSETVQQETVSLPMPESALLDTQAPGREKESLSGLDPLAAAVAELVGNHDACVVSYESDVASGELFNELIVQQDTCSLYWLARTLGKRSAHPIWLAELLHLGSHYQPTFISLRVRISELCNIAGSNLQELNEKQKLLLATAILRPALMMPEQSMDTITAILASSLIDYDLGDFLDELRRIVRNGKPLEDIVFLRQSSTSLETQKIILQKETEELLQRILRGKMNYQPATKLRKELFEKRGAIGKVLDACIRNIDNGLQEFVNQYQDVRAIETLIDRSHAKNSRRSIEAGARQKLIDEIAAASALVKRWATYFQRARSSNSEPSSYAQQRLEGLHKVLRKSKLQSCAEGDWFVRQMENLCTGEMLSVSPLKELELWPLRLPCAYLQEGAVFTPPALVNALHTREFDDKTAVAASLAIHMAKGRLSTTGEFLSLFPEYRDVEPASAIFAKFAPALQTVCPFSIEKIRLTSEHLWQKAFERELEELKEFLSDSYFRGAILYDQQSKLNLQIDDIILRSSTCDKSISIQELRKIRKKLQEWNESSLEAVCTRISELRTKAASFTDALSFLDSLEEEVRSNNVFSAAWDNIARLEDYLSQRGDLPSLHTESTLVRSTARQFYAQIANGNIDPTDKESQTLWQKVCNLRNYRNLDGSFLRYTTEFLRWLGFTLAQSEQPKEIFTSGPPNYWRLSSYSMVLNSPLPQWGSSARGQHVIAFGWDVSPAAINNLLTSPYITKNCALFVICCGYLSSAARKEILRFAKSWPTFPIVIDSSLFNFLSSVDAAVRTEKMFEAALAGSSYNPYTPDVAGAVPREMFFGREDDKTSILSEKGTCIIYGGRQLGKSALLQQIYEEYNFADNSLRSHDKEGVKVIHYTMSVQDTSILDVVIKQCIKAGIVDSRTTRKTLKDNVLTWLRQGNGRRVLVLLDECDSILDEDFRNDFHDVWELRNLMQESIRSFKVVFTGLHSVQRFSHVINNPLYHFGDPICVGPLSTEAAYGLMTKPMSLLGLEFETPQLVQMALNYCNYQPKLIQMFCSELVDGINKLSSREPVHIIDKSTMLKVYDSQDLKTRIRDCFTMTLALDTRYLVIGYVMALLQGEDISIRKLQSELRSYWPAAFAAGCGGDVNTLQSLLYEMEGLGLVISLGGTYRLRTPHITELLGGQENVLLQLEQFYDRPYQPVADPDELRMDDDAVLVASQYNLLADKSSRICWVSGSKALGLELMPKVLKNIAQKTETDYLGKMRYAALSGMTVPEAMKSLRGFYEKLPEGGLIVSISSSEFPYMLQFIQSAEDWLGKLRTDRKYVKIVCLVDPSCLYEFIRDGSIERLSSYHIPLLPWTENSVDYWCKAKTLPGVNSKELLEKTGGWHILTYPSLSSSKGSNVPPRADDFIPAVHGLSQLVVSLNELGGETCPEEDIIDLIDIPDRMTTAKFHFCLELLKNLHILRESSKGLHLEPVAAQIIAGDLR